MSLSRESSRGCMSTEACPSVTSVRGARTNSKAGDSSRVTIVVPGERRVGIAADFPEPFLILVGNRDLLHPLCPFPRITLWDDDTDRPAVLLRERLTVPFKTQQDIVIITGLER